MLFLDETAFTKTTHMTRTWSPRGVHIQVDQAQVYTGYRSVIATVSCEAGVVLLDIEESITKKEEVSRYLVKLSRRMNKQPFYLFMDKASAHTAGDVKRVMESLNIIPIFNITACPEFNPIEAVFSFVKKDFRRARLNALANKRDFDLDRECNKAFKCVTPDLVTACWKRSLY